MQVQLWPGAGRSSSSTDSSTASSARSLCTYRELRAYTRGPARPVAQEEFQLSEGKPDADNAHPSVESLALREKQAAWC